MQPETDLGTTSLDTNGGTGSQPNPAESKPIDYKAKYTGMQSLYDRTVKQLSAVQEQANQTAAQYEAEIAELRAAKDAAQAEAKKAQAWETEKQRLEAERDKHKSRFETFGKLQEKYPNLSDSYLRGYLKEQNEFETPEQYDEYLQYESAARTAVAPQTQQRNFGTVPTINTAQRPTAATARSIEDIQDEMDRVNTRTAEGQARFNLLVEEMDKALSRQKK